MCGVTVRSKNKIYINKNLQKDLFRRTIIHELTHAYIWSYGLNQVESFKEENICDFLESHGDSIIGTANCVYNDLLKHLDDYCEIDMESFNDTNSKGIDKGLK